MNTWDQWMKWLRSGKREKAIKQREVSGVRYKFENWYHDKAKQQGQIQARDQAKMASDKSRLEGT